MNGVFVASTYPLNSILIFEAVSHSPNTPTMGIKTNEDLEADYVIVGGGTSGIVLAARLSEDDSKSVIIREAGRNLADDFRVQTPALWTTLLGSEADWQLITAPQVSLFFFVSSTL